MLLIYIKVSFIIVPSLFWCYCIYNIYNKIMSYISNSDIIVFLMYKYIINKDIYKIYLLDKNYFMKLLTNKYIDVNEYDEYYNNFMSVMIDNDDIKINDMLNDKNIKIDINKQNVFGNSILMLLIYKKNFDIENLIKKRVKDIKLNIKNVYNENILMQIYKRKDNNLELIKFIKNEIIMFYNENLDILDDTIVYIEKKKNINLSDYDKEIINILKYENSNSKSANKR